MFLVTTGGNWKIFLGRRDLVFDSGYFSPADMVFAETTLETDPEV
jgi:hypothetical protein